MTARAVRDSFARLGTTFTVAGSPSRISILLHTTPTYLAPALALTATLLRQPRFEPAAFDSIQADILAGLAEDSASVVDLASARLLQALSPYPPSHPLATLSPGQELSVQRRVTLGDVRKVYSDLVGASFGDIAIVGTVPRQAVRDLVTRLFADWRSPQPFSLILRRPYDPPGTLLRLAVPSATTVLYQARRNVNVPVNSQEHAALVLGQYIFGRGFSRSCLAAIPAIFATERPTCDLVITLTEGVGDLTIRAAAKAENIQALKGAIGREIDRVREVGVSLEEVERAKSEWVQEQRTSRSRDDQLAVRLSNQWLAGRTFADDATFERLIAALTPAAVTAVLRQYLDPRRLTAIEAGPPVR
jgi:zinc protease